MLVLGIETSCDETAVALVEGGRAVVQSKVASSLPSHQRYGGVVPEIASRAHVEFFTLLCDSLFKEGGVTPSQIDRIAVTNGPGLPGCLMMGVSAAKALALAWGKQVVPVNHLQAHLYAAFMGVDWPVGQEPVVGLVISGGHTALVKMEKGFTLLGQTRDDAVGEAFDKVAKLLGLGFPGGPEIERVAKKGNPKAFRFTFPKIKQGLPFDFSYSGIKTAVLYKVRELEKKGPKEEFVADMAASFQHSVIEEIVEKTRRACQSFGISRVAVGGGVVANRPLREKLAEVCADFKIGLAVPPIALCTDNGVMVAGLGHRLSPVSPEKLAAVPDLRVELN